MQQLQLYCNQRKKQNWSDLSHADIRSHLAARHRQGLGGKSLQRELSAIRSFFNFLCKIGALSLNPANGLRAPKSGRKLPKVIDVDQVSGLLDQNTDDPLEIRDLAMFELFYSSGLRLSELVALNIIDIDLKAGSVRVRSGKGNKSRNLPVGKKAIQALQQWFNVRQRRVTTSEPAVFISTRGRRLGNRSVQLRLQRWCRKIGLPEHIHPHMLRHSFASHLLEFVEPYSVNRTKRLIKAPKLYWGDVGLALHLSRGEPSGAHLENLVLLDLLAWADSVQGARPSILYWRTASGQEIDAVIEHGTGLIGIEVKAAGQPHGRDARHLRAFRDEYGDAVLGCLLLHTGDETYRLEDRIVVAPWWRVL